MDSGRRAGCVSDPTGLVQKLAFPFNLSKSKDDDYEIS